jgi:hypothetical protein
MIYKQIRCKTCKKKIVIPYNSDKEYCNKCSWLITKKEAMKNGLLH